jgi:outer membrane protein OmpA-like peptidoglycan-associated protein
VSNLVLAQKQDTITIYYKIDESSIQKIQHCKLDSVVKVLKDSASIKVAIYGYSDHSGTDQYNLNLTDARAKKVETYLLNKGINPNAISLCIGKGKVQSKGTNDKLLSEPLHRKVELILIKAQDSPTNKNTSISPVLADSTSIVIRMRNLNIGDSLVLNNINFEPASSVILKESIKPLKELLKVLLESPTLKIEIQGHTDCTPAFEKARILSTDRARTICDFLIRNGINSNRLQYIGYGNSRPIIKAITEEAGLKNRRVEIKIIDK